MLQRIVSILMLSLLVFGLKAQQGDLSTEEYQRRDAELRMLANRFKQETGFEGNIQNNPQMMKLSHFTGGFPDLIFPTASDTVQARQVCNQIVDRILPYLQIPEEQLSLESIGGDDRVLRAQYRQRVNGYEIEGAGILRIAYYYSSEQTHILNVLVHIDPTPVIPRITEEEARRIGQNEYKDSQFYTQHTANYQGRAFILYCKNPQSLKENDYNLYWRVGFPGISYYIHSVTGNIDFYNTLVLKDYDY